MTDDVDVWSPTLLKNSVGDVLLAGGYRTAEELATMSDEDKRNTLIVVLSNNTLEDTNYYHTQPNGSLIGFGGVFICLVKGNVATVDQLKILPRSKHREILITVIGNQFGKMQYNGDLQFRPDWDLVNFFIQGFCMYCIPTHT